jgi:hypothetical protein
MSKPENIGSVGWCNETNEKVFKFTWKSGNNFRRVKLPKREEERSGVAVWEAGPTRLCHAM